MMGSRRAEPHYFMRFFGRLSKLPLHFWDCNGTDFIV